MQQRSTEWLGHSKALQPKLLYLLSLARVLSASHPLFYGVQQFHSNPIDPTQHRQYATSVWLGSHLGQLLVCPGAPRTAQTLLP